MSMKLNFTPHSYYYGHAIMDPKTPNGDGTTPHTWRSIYYDGVKGCWVERETPTLKMLKSNIKAYHFNYYQEKTS